MLTPWPSLKLLLYPSQNLVWEMHPMEMCQLVDHCQTLGRGVASLPTRWGKPEYDPLAWQGGVRQRVFEWQVGVNSLKPHCFMLFISFWFQYCCYFVHKFGALTFPSAMVFFASSCRFEVILCSFVQFCLDIAILRRCLRGLWAFRYGYTSPVFMSFLKYSRIHCCLKGSRHCHPIVGFFSFLTVNSILCCPHFCTLNYLTIR